jgi:uncharacterized protein YidB (DUF937 family)
MGLLDLAGQFLGGNSGGGDSKAQLLNVAMGLIQNQPGGLQGLLGKFQGSGMGDHVASWVGNGENLPISADQVQQALGSDQVEALAQQAGIPAEHASSGLAAMLPEIIHHLTPDGQVPQGANLQQGLGGLLGKLLG